MSYQGRALYNLLAMNFERQPSLTLEKWQTEDYRSFSEERLFKKLKADGISLDKEKFLDQVKEVDSPEELTDLLYLGEDFDRHERIFLSLFELWRRFVREKISPSIFCDELDHLIEEYEAGNLDREEELQSALLGWQKILDDHVDKGGDSSEAFDILSEFSCHDLEIFIYEYIAHQIDIENDLYASELLEGFYDSIKKVHWFDFLRVRLIFAVDPEEGRAMVQRLIEMLEDVPDLKLLFEILHFFIYAGEINSVLPVFRSALKGIECEADLQELLMIASDYMNCVEKFSEERIVNRLIEERKGKPLNTVVTSEDSAILHIKELMIFSPA